MDKNWLKKIQPSNRTIMNKNPITSKQATKIIALHKKGKSQRAIAESVGRSRSGVWGVLVREGLIKKPKVKKLVSKSEARRLAVQKGRKR